MLLGKKEDNSIDKKIVDTIRGLGIDIIDYAKSGHPGIALGAAPIIATVYGNQLKFNVNDEKWINRDRFIMSAGHGSALLYSTLFAAGFNITMDDLKSFRKLDSITPGHPEYGITPGVDMSTGPLGQGIASAVGIAIGEAYLRDYFGKDIINYYTYVLCGDGDLMEGISYEATSLAGKLGLDKLIVLYDSNDITLDGRLDSSFKEDMKMRFNSINWNYILVENGEDTNAIDMAIEKAKVSDKPTLIEIKTVIGKYSRNEGTNTVHGAPLETEDIIDIKNKLGLRDIPFGVSNDSIEAFRELINERYDNSYEVWKKKVDNLNEEKKKDLESLLNNKLPIKLKDIYYELPEDGMDSTRVASGKIINSIAEKYNFLIGGSADTSKSTNARIKNTKDFSSEEPSGRNINFGIREHAMGAIANGLALTGLTPFVSTFLPFFDYLKPAVRMSALMNLPVIYVFTHDSISVGEDGPTHEAIEQLVSLRSIPNLDVYRPADSNEVVGTYKTIFETRKPSAVILGRNKVIIQDTTSSKEVTHGAYIVKQEQGKLSGIIIATGEEMEIAIELYDRLLSKGIKLRIVSMPSIERFEQEDVEYRKSILPLNAKTFVIEASSSYSWHKYVDEQSHLFTIDKFGASGNREAVLKKYGFDVDTIEKKLEEILK